MELYHLRSTDDPLAKVIKDDPVRPHIPLNQRINDAAEILILKAGEEVLAATCMQWLHDIPENEQDLIDMAKDKQVAVFYTIWSYRAGAGQRLLRSVLPELKIQYPSITTFVTLSPKTELARRFHLKNGAVVLSENDDTINYDYSDRNIS